MGRDLAIAGAACLTPAESDLATALLQLTDERQVDDPTWPLVEAFADRECPVMPPPEQADIKAIIGTLAGTLKAPRMSLDQGRLQLAMYWRALQDVELFRVQLAAEHFIRTAEWMPTPGQVRTQALTYSHPVYHAHTRARRLVRDRRQRLGEETRRAIQHRTLTQEELDQLTDAAKQSGISAGDLIPTPEGGVTYRTREAIDRWVAHATAQLEHRKDE